MSSPKKKYQEDRIATPNKTTEGRPDEIENIREIYHTIGRVLRRMIIEAEADDHLDANALGRTISTHTKLFYTILELEKNLDSCKYEKSRGQALDLDTARREILERIYQEQQHRDDEQLS